MVAETSPAMLIALAALAWLFTYALHSTLLLSSAWVATRRLGDARAGLRERIWKFAVIAAFVTSSVQVGLGFEPLGGRLALRQVAPSDFAPEGMRDAPAGRDAGHELAAAPRVNEQAVLQGGPLVWPVLKVGNWLAKQARNVTLPIDANLAEPRSAVNGAAAPVGELARSTEPALLGNVSEKPASPVAAGSESSAVAGSARSPSAAGESGRGEWTQWAIACCAIGALAGLLLFALLWVRLNGCLRDRTPLEHGAMAEMLRDLCKRAGVRRKVRLSLAPSLGAPISMGMFRAEICVPPRALVELTEEEQEALLAHELAHVVRRDPLWLAACRLFEGVFFFQPLNRVARREIEDCAEFLSDAWAVRTTGLRFSLASCLTRIAEWIIGERRSLPAPAMAHGRSRLRHRVELLLDETSAERVERLPRWLAPACLGFGASLIAVVPSVRATEVLFEKGDNGRLAYMPERGHEPSPAALSSPGPAESGEQVDCEKTPESAASEASDLFDELGREFQALEADLGLLHEEAAALAWNKELAREIGAELTQLEMKLTHLRGLAARIDSLRAAFDERAPASPTPADPGDQPKTLRTSMTTTEIPQ